MMAELTGRVSGVGFDKATGALTQVVIESQHGELAIFKPDAWTDDLAFKEALGRNVEVSVVVRVLA